MNIETRHAHRRRRKLIAAALVTTTLTACAQDPPKPKPLTAGSLDDRDFTRLRAAGGPHVVTPKLPRRRHARKPVSGSANGIPAVWVRVAECESSQRWHIVSPPFYGGLQIMAMNSRDYGFARADRLSPSEQVRLARLILRDQGVRAWPICGPRAGLSMSDAA